VQIYGTFSFCANLFGSFFKIFLPLFCKMLIATLLLSHEVIPADAPIRAADPRHAGCGQQSHRRAKLGSWREW
jgi:hypothetical protein